MRNASAAKKEGNGIKKRKSKQERRFFLLGLLFVSPWLIGFLCFQLYPILSALYYSFTDFNIFQPAEFTGLDNYVTLFNDKYFPVSLKNTAVMSFIGMPIGLVVALALAVLLIGGGAAWYFKIYRPKHQGAAAPEEDYGGADPCDGPEDYGDGPPWDEDEPGDGEPEE